MRSMPDDLDALRSALELSPENVPLRTHLARSLLSRGAHAEAEELLRAGLRLAPDSQELKLTLARCYRIQGKTSAAFVIVEDLIKRSPDPAPAYLLHARLLLDTGERERAAREYRKALREDPDAADRALEKALGLDDEDDPELPALGPTPIRLEAEGLEDLDPSAFRLERPTITFAEVGGMDAVKEEVRLKIIHPLTRPELYAAYGKSVGGGILLYGPPGCGKTHLARATAGEVDAAFLAVGIDDVLDMWLGNSEKNLHALFALARRERPCVLFFDEVDALGAKRSAMRHHGGRNVINQFLAELDGAKASNEGVLVLAATNAPWHLDAAFRRPGRFDRIIFVPPPDEAAREQILRILLRGKPVADLDHAKLARKARHFSGADLMAAVDRAVEAKLAEALAAGVPKPLTQKDLLAALKRTKPSTREWFATARNYALYANEGGLYDDLLPWIE